MVILSFIVGSLVVGCLLYLPFFLWFRRQGRLGAGMISADLDTSLKQALVEARKLRHVTLSAEHLLLALVRNPKVSKVLSACSVEVDDLHDHLVAILRENTPAASGSEPVDPKASVEFQRVIQRAIMLVQATRGSIATSTGFRNFAWRVFARPLAFFKGYIGSGTVDGADVLVAVFSERESLAVKALLHYGVTRFDVTSYLAHGFTNSDAVVPLATHSGALGPMNVVLINDDFTPMEFVTTVLKDHFGLDLDSAIQVMLKVHRDGRAVCGRFAANVAAEKVELVRAGARQEGHPLLCIVEPV
jgi:ATP-dependent Clp protease adaptor protein ClpS